jgi:hypothetical protein
MCDEPGLIKGGAGENQFAENAERMALLTN